MTLECSAVGTVFREKGGGGAVLKVCVCVCVCAVLKVYVCGGVCPEGVLLTELAVSGEGGGGGVLYLKVCG